MDIHDLVLTSGAFAELVRRLTAGSDRVQVSCGLSRLPERWEWLVATLHATPGDTLSFSAMGDTQVGQLIQDVSAAAEKQSVPGAILGIGLNAAAGYVCGMAVFEGKLPLRSLRIAGPSWPGVDFSTLIPTSLPAPLWQRFI